MNGWLFRCPNCGEEWEPLFVPVDGSPPLGSHSSERTGCDRVRIVADWVMLDEDVSR